MAIHDLWSFDNAPQSSSDISAGTSLTYPNPGTYNQYTGLPGVLYKNTGGQGTITSDGFLNLISSASWNPGLVIKASDVQDWSVATQYWIGFRTKIVSTQSTSTTALFRVASTLAQAAYTTILAESDMTTAGAATIGTEYYVEIFIDRTALTYQAYINGKFYASGALGASAAAGCFYFWGGLNSASATANATRSFRDFYFLDVDSVDKGRLGPIRSNPAALASAAGSEWALNGSPSSLLVALNTALQSPPTTTPSASSPADNQAISAALSTAIATGTPIIAVQPQLTIGGDANLNVLDVGFSQASNVLDAGRLVLPVSSTTYNQRWPIVRSAPDGGVWTPAKVNATNAILTPITAPKTVLLLHFDGVNGATTTTDTTGINPGLSFKGNAQISTVQSKFGGASLFPNSAATGGISIPDATWLRFTGDCTIEAWVQVSSSSQNGVLFGKDPASSTFADLQYYQGNWRLWLDGTSSTASIVATSGVAINTWMHIAVVRYSGVWYLYQNGILLGQVSGGTLGSNSQPFTIGNTPNLATVFQGYIDEFRVSNFARYTAPFTPPTAAFTPD